jgi:adenylate cyclase
VGGEAAREAPPVARRAPWPTQRAASPQAAGPPRTVPPLSLWTRQPGASGSLAAVSGLSLREAAERAGVSPDTLRRWARAGVIPQYDGSWSPAAVAHARIVSRLRERGHSLEEIKRAGTEGVLSFAYIEDLFPPADRSHTLEEAAALCGLEPALIERINTSIGFPAQSLERITEEDLQLLRYIAAVLSAGFPLVAFLQLIRVYGQALAQIADAEVRLFHLYVHEPLMRDGVPGLEMAEEMESLARELLPLASPIMDHLHQRFLQHFVEQDVVGHMETDVEDRGLDLGRLRVAIAFADLAGYTRLTEEEGEETALDAVERFVESVEETLPEEARVVKTIGDEVMIVGSDPGAVTDWAVGFQQLARERPLPRIGIHYGETIYRDGDYYGREVNLASRVAARAAGGEVLVTRPVIQHAGPHLEFEPIGEVRLKGFRQATELFVARPVEE